MIKAASSSRTKQKAQAARGKRVEKALVAISKAERAAPAGSELVPGRKVVPPPIKVPADILTIEKREPAAPVDLGRPFLLQVTPEQEEWLEAQRRALGFRSRAETIRHWLQRAVEGRIG